MKLVLLHSTFSRIHDNYDKPDNTGFTQEMIKSVLQMTDNDYEGSREVLIIY